MKFLIIGVIALILSCSRETDRVLSNENNVVSSSLRVWKYSDPEIPQIFSIYCAECHIGVSATSGLELDTYANITASADNISKINNRMIIQKTMPSRFASAGNPTAEELAIIAQWIEQGAQE